MKKIICFILAVMLVISQVSYVFASETEAVTEVSSDADVSYEGYYKFLSDNAKSKIASYLFSELGYISKVSDFAIDINDCFMNALLGSDYSSYEDFVKKCYDEDKNQVVVPRQVVNNFNLKINNQIVEQYGYEIYPSSGQNTTWVVNHLKYYAAGVAHAADIKAALDKNNYSHISIATTASNSGSKDSNVFVYGTTDNYLIKNASGSNVWCFDVYDVDCNRLSAEDVVSYSSDIDWYKMISNDSSDYWHISVFTRRMNYSYFVYQHNAATDVTGTMYLDPWRSYAANPNFYYFKNDTKVFSSLESLNNYLYGEQVLFNLSCVNERIDNLTVSVDALSTDFEKYQKDAVDAIIKAIKDNKSELNVDTLTEEQLRKIVDSIVGEKLDSLNSLIASGNDTNSFQNTLIYQKLCQIYDLLDKWYTGDDTVDDILNPDNTDFSKLYKYFEVYDLKGEADNIFKQILVSINNVPAALLDGIDKHLDDALNKFFDDKLEPLLRELIVPDDETIDSTLESLNTSLPFISGFSNFASDFVDAIGQVDSDSFDGKFRFVSLSGSDSESDNDVELQSDSVAVYSSGDGMLLQPDAFSDLEIVFDFSWFLPYRTSYLIVVRGFMWLCFLFKLFFKLPKLVAGDADLLGKGGD